MRVRSHHRLDRCGRRLEAVEVTVGQDSDTEVDLPTKQLFLRQWIRVVATGRDMVRLQSLQIARAPTLDVAHRDRCVDRHGRRERRRVDDFRNPEALETADLAAQEGLRQGVLIASC